MSEILEEFWIFSKGGDPLVNFYKEPNLVGSFNYRDVSFDHDTLSNIKDYIITNLQNSSQKSKNLMKFENAIVKYVQCLQNDLIIFYKTNPNVKEKAAVNLCKTISSILEDAYPQDKLAFWEGDLAFFDKFKHKVSLYFKMSAL
ncbi:MAG: hypothetical protein EAX91_14640 [Candidatus Lokiarchaeota archaeon]|nr:hypothetical protein [Candidatus Lokiarchaeota archaeon]